MPRIPISEPPLDRAALLDAVDQAASAAGLGEDDSEQQRLLDGKRFELRIRFGCPRTDADVGKERFAVAFNEEERTLRIRAVQDLTLNDPLVGEFAPETVEAVEGFWLQRPWVRAARCPLIPRIPPQPTKIVTSNAKMMAGARDAEDAPAMPPPAEARAAPRVGIAQFFTEADARTARRNQRAYETTKVLADGEQPSPEGYNFVLSGRLRGLAGGRVINCGAPSFATPPDCVLSAEFDRVWMEQPDGRAVVAEWSR